MSRLFGIFLIVVAAVLGWIISERERSQTPPSVSTPVTQAKLTSSRPRLVAVVQKTPAPPQGPIAEFDLVGTRRAELCPTMGALEAVPAPGANEKPCPKKPVPRRAR